MRYSFQMKRLMTEVIMKNTFLVAGKKFIYICLTSLTRAKPKEKMEFPA